MKRIATLTLSLILGALVSSCSTTLTQEGSLVRTLNSNDDLSKCEFRGIITAKSPEFAITPTQENEYVMNDARNKVAAKGGTHMKLLTSQYGIFSGANINAEAFKCAK